MTIDKYAAPGAKEDVVNWIYRLGNDVDRLGLQKVEDSIVKFLDDAEIYDSQVHDMMDSEGAGFAQLRPEHMPLRGRVAIERAAQRHWGY